VTAVGGIIRRLQEEDGWQQIIYFGVGERSLIRITDMETWTEILKSHKFWVAIVASLILKEVLTWLSVLTTAGVLRLWSKILYVITLGSTTVRDAPYASAAVNPYPVPSLMIIVLLLMVGMSFIGYILCKAYWRAITRYFKNKSNSETNKTQDTPSAPIRKQVLVLVVATIYFGAFFFALIIPFGIENEAVASRRIYEADKEMVAPYLTSSQLVQIQADFAGIETRAQYKILMDRLAAVAEEHNVKIHKVTW
jgi:hypothetical protein